MKNKTISGFSRLPKSEKINWVTAQFFQDPINAENVYKSYILEDKASQKVFDGFSENTISNFIVPYGIAPNFIINGQTYAVPMVIEESSVVAAASSAAKFWMNRGGFKYEIHDIEKLGQLHFFWHGEPALLRSAFDYYLRLALEKHLEPFTSNMVKRGGGVRSIELLDKTDEISGFYQLLLRLDTCDSMGANFTNTLLEECLRKLKEVFSSDDRLKNGPQPDFLMAILSNYTPDCRVTASVSCCISQLKGVSQSLTAEEFANRFQKAVQIARIDKYRAVTHNKGIFNGIDAVVLATANDFRAVEACGHAYACRDGAYRSLTQCSIENDEFKFWLDIPLALGTVGGLTCLHPLASSSLELLGKPSARELMGIAACTGLAQNFAAIRSLITTGIQYGHMKMHLENILNHLNASEIESDLASVHFQNSAISFNAVRSFLEDIRCHKQEIRKILKDPSDV